MIQIDHNAQVSLGTSRIFSTNLPCIKLCHDDEWHLASPLPKGCSHRASNFHIGWSRFFWLLFFLLAGSQLKSDFACAGLLCSFLPSNAFMASARSFNTFNCMLQIRLQGLISAYKRSSKSELVQDLSAASRPSRSHQTKPNTNQKQTRQHKTNQKNNKKQNRRTKL